MIHDRDTKFTDEFVEILGGSDVRCLELPARSPNLNAFAERFVLSIKSECFSHMIFFGENSLRRAVGQFLEHYHHERNHQGLGNELIEPSNVINGGGEVQCQERLGGLLKYYHRAA